IATCITTIVAVAGTLLSYVKQLNEMDWLCKQCMPGEIIYVF
ncbi:unnamed protein product, partial [marine sediment metagenome]